MHFVLCSKQGMYFRIFLSLTGSGFSNPQWLTYTQILVKYLYPRGIIQGFLVYLEWPRKWGYRDGMNLNSFKCALSLPWTRDCLEGVGTDANGSLEKHFNEVKPWLKLDTLKAWTLPTERQPSALPLSSLHKYLIIKLCYCFIHFPHKMCKKIMHTVNYWLTTKDTSLILTVGWFLYGVSLLSTSLQTHLIIAIIKPFRRHSDNLFFFISSSTASLM